MNSINNNPTNLPFNNNSEEDNPTTTNLPNDCIQGNSTKNSRAATYSLITSNFSLPKRHIDNEKQQQNSEKNSFLIEEMVQQLSGKATNNQIAPKCSTPNEAQNSKEKNISSIENSLKSRFSNTLHFKQKLSQSKTCTERITYALKALNFPDNLIGDKDYFKKELIKAYLDCANEDKLTNNFQRIARASFEALKLLIDNKELIDECHKNLIFAYNGEKGSKTTLEASQSLELHYTDIEKIALRTYLINAFIDQAKKYNTSNEFAKAEHVALEGLKIPGCTDKQKNELYGNIIVSYGKQNKYKEAIDIAFQELELSCCTINRKVVLCQFLCFAYCKEENYYAAEEAIELGLALPGCSDKQKAELYNQVASIFYKNDMKVNAYSSIFNALLHLEKVKPNDNDLQKKILAKLDQFGSCETIAEELLQLRDKKRIPSEEYEKMVEILKKVKLTQDKPQNSEENTPKEIKPKSRQSKRGKSTSNKQAKKRPADSQLGDQNPRKKRKHTSDPSENSQNAKIVNSTEKNAQEAIYTDNHEQSAIMATVVEYPSENSMEAECIFPNISIENKADSQIEFANQTSLIGLKPFPDNFEFYKLMQKIAIDYNGQEKAETAAAEIQKVLKSSLLTMEQQMALYRLLIPICINLSGKYINENKFDRAIEFASMGIKSMFYTNEQKLQLACNLTISYNKLNQFKQAILCILDALQTPNMTENQIVTLNYDLISAYYHLSQKSIRSNNFPEAEQSALKGLKMISCTNTAYKKQFYRNLVISCSKQNKFKDVVIHASEGLKLTNCTYNEKVEFCTHLIYSIGQTLDYNNQSKLDQTIKQALERLKLSQLICSTDLKIELCELLCLKFFHQKNNRAVDDMIKIGFALAGDNNEHKAKLYNQQAFICFKQNMESDGLKSIFFALQHARQDNNINLQKIILQQLSVFGSCKVVAEKLSAMQSQNKISKGDLSIMIKILDESKNLIADFSIFPSTN